jgi:4'-phosphopantetheinyl transferase
MGVGALANRTVAQRRPALYGDEVAVWRLPADHPRPLETVLALYLGVEQTSLTLARTPLGKPELPGAPLRFNLAHSGDVALVAVTQARDVGVDVETRREDADRWSLVHHALTSRERRRVESMPRARRADAFLSIWTRKEALLKAAGVGLAIDPARVQLDDSSVVAVPPELGSSGDWTIVDIPPPGHFAAVAVRGRVSALRGYAAP